MSESVLINNKYTIQDNDCLKKWIILNNICM